MRACADADGDGGDGGDRRGVGRKGRRLGGWFEPTVRRTHTNTNTHATLCLTRIRKYETKPTTQNNSSGGIVLTSADGRIVCANTLDDRVAISYEANLPEIRAQLFGTTAAVH